MTSTSSELKNVVVIGCGLAGAGAINELMHSLPPNSHRIVAISATESAFYPIAALRGAVVKGWEDKVTLPLEPIFGKDSRHILLQGVSVTKLSAHSIELDKVPASLSSAQAAQLRLSYGDAQPSDSSITISFDYCVIATGSTYPFPCRPPTDRASTVDSVRAALRDLQAQVTASDSLLIIGGGPVGVEFATEVAHEHKGKRITLVHAGDHLIEGPFKTSVGEGLKTQAEKMGIVVHLNEKVDTGELKTGKIERQTFELASGEKIEADFLMIAYGNQPNTAIVKEAYPTLIASDDRIRVRPTFQLDSEDLGHIFALGDVAALNETKLWYNAQSHAPIVAANIAILARAAAAPGGGGVDASKLKTYASPSQPVIVVCAGPRGGMSQLPFGIVVGAWATAMAKSKSMFVDKFKSLYHAK